MNNNKGVTLVSMLIIVVVMAIIAGVSIFGGTDILNTSHESKIKENKVAVEAAVNRVNIKLSTAGTLTPANVKMYGKQASKILHSVGILSGENLSNWYILEEDDLKEMGIEYLEEGYIVNYEDNKVYSLSEYEASKE